MESLYLVHSRSPSKLRTIRSEFDHLRTRSPRGKPQRVRGFPIPASSEIIWNSARPSRDAGGFLNGLSAKARRDFDLIAPQFSCPVDATVIREEQEPSSVMVLIDGEVKISMNSLDGRRFLLEVAGPGDILGLTSVMSGKPSDITAEAMYPCMIASLRREDFLAFLLRHPVAFQCITRELTLHCARACERLRLLCLTSSVKARLAGLILKWCKSAKQTKSGAEIRCAHSRAEIGEHIGESSDTVARTLAEFVDHNLVKLRGSVLIVPSCGALAFYAGVCPMPDPTEPAA